jgi:hypothetical protein
MGDLAVAMPGQAIRGDHAVVADAEGLGAVGMLVAGQRVVDRRVLALGKQKSVGPKPRSRKQADHVAMAVDPDRRGAQPLAELEIDGVVLYRARHVDRKECTMAPPRGFRPAGFGPDVHETVLEPQRIEIGAADIAAIVDPAPGRAEGAGIVERPEFAVEPHIAMIDADLVDIIAGHLAPGVDPQRGADQAARIGERHEVI